MNNFVFIIPFRNVANYIDICTKSLLLQSYKNWKAIFIDDVSNDGSMLKIPNDPRFIKIINEERVTALPNIHNAIINNKLEEEDIICILDGDDYLLRQDSLEILNKFYNDNNQILLSYGQYVTTNGHLGHCAPYTIESFKSLRKGGYWASHLRTFKYKLYLELLKQDPNVKCYKDKDDKYYTICYDIAIMTPLMEIAGFDKVGFNPIPIYVYRLHPQNDHVVNGRLQKQIEIEIFAKESFKQIF